jgi:hypothetical protein
MLEKEPTSSSCVGEQCSRHYYQLRRGSKVSTRQRFHGERAAHFKRHASNTKNPDTREMYLHLAEVEMTLAAKEVEAAKEPEQQTPRQAKAAISEPTNET